MTFGPKTSQARSFWPPSGCGVGTISPIAPHEPNRIPIISFMTVAAQSGGRRIQCADAWVAATALLSRAPLLTHNRSDYLGVPGLALLSHAG